MSTLPSVTIGITCFNAADTIVRCVESALTQNYPNYDIIIVDDCSTDGSSLILRSFSSSIITLLENTYNLGCSASRNLIVSTSQSDLICFLDDDDASHPDRLYLQVQALLNVGFKANPYIVCMPSMVRHYPSGYSKYFSALGTTGKPPTPFQFFDYLLFNKHSFGVDYGYCCPTASLMTSRQLFIDSGMFDVSMKRVEDNDIVLRFCQLSCFFVGIDIPLVFQSSSVSSDKSYRINLLSELRLLRKHKSYLLSCSMYRYSRLSVFLRYYYFKRFFAKFFAYICLLFLDHPFYSISHYSRTFLRRGIHDLRIKFGL